LLVLLESFWHATFRETWARAATELARSLEQAERLFAACTFEEFATRALLRVTVDEDGETLTAIRGGYRVRLEDIASCHFLPSMFNDRRFWSAYGSAQSGRVIVHFPYFDPALSPGGMDVLPEAEPEIDPRLVFRALGDATRYAVVALLARGPTTATELARALAISKPTMSHHLGELRAAGLVTEERSWQTRRNVTLSLRRDVLERLSAATVAQLFDDPKPIRALARTRSGLEKTRSTS
jgi:DNA-binding transcriptional ArsR family regulator